MCVGRSGPRLSAHTQSTQGLSLASAPRALWGRHRNTSCAVEAEKKGAARKGVSCRHGAVKRALGSTRLSNLSAGSTTHRFR